jgi:hypothetical protein
LVYSSDYWDFPTNKFPTTGWLGRVHRGTPWQTVYLKSSDVQVLGAWMDWTGNLNPIDAYNARPVQDRLLFDLFTTAFNDNSTRGTLSVNVGSAPGEDNLAAWSALFSGIVAPTNLLGGYTVIAPAGTNAAGSALGMLVTNINFARNNFINADGLQGVFEHAGSILITPQLTEQSPFLSGLNPTNQITDEACETIPSQLLSLLRADSIGSVAPANGQMAFQFTGYDGHSYAIEASSDLVNWTSIATNNPANGVLTFTNPPPVNTSRQFYRSVLLQ